jgi:hypothetical protein
MIVSVKDTVRASGITPELVWGLQVARSVFEDHGVPMYVTSMRDSRHMEKSLHYSGKAADLRLPSRYTTVANSDERVVADLRRALGPEWDVVLEVDHIHFEFDPKENTDASVA